jgi:ATP-dependent DNA helicase RecG
MTVFGDLDISTLTELPAGRSPITTHVVPAAEKPRFAARVWERVAEEVASGRQAYIVCPRIGEEPGADGTQAVMAGADPGPRAALAGTRGRTAEGGLFGDAGLADDEPTEDGALFGDSRGDGGLTEDGALFEADGSRSGADGQPPGADGRPPVAVLDLAPELEQGPLAGSRLAILHGRLPADEKDRVMRSFADGSVDVLITTTVVEVGVDVPNATAMVIMDADRFGVSQLHQLRGRVGRGSHEGLCLLVTEAPQGTKSRERLDAVAATLDGFTLSRLDLEQRREGDVLGAAQAGRKSSLKLLTLLKDEELIGQARQAATALVAADPALAGHPALAAAVGALLDHERAEFLEKA